MLYVVCCIGGLSSLPCWSLEVGDAAPNIVAININGGILSLKRTKKTPKVINFFWVECRPCKKELPLLAEKEEQYKNVEFYAVHAEANPDTGDNYEVAAVKQFIASLEGAPKTVALGSPLLKEHYDIKGLPHTVLLSANNRVDGIIRGFNRKTKKQIQAWLEKQ